MDISHNRAHCQRDRLKNRGTGVSSVIFLGRDTGGTPVLRIVQRSRLPGKECGRNNFLVSRDAQRSDWRQRRMKFLDHRGRKRVAIALFRRVRLGGRVFWTAAPYDDASAKADPTGWDFGRDDPVAPSRLAPRRG